METLLIRVSYTATRRNSDGSSSSRSPVRLAVLGSAGRGRRTSGLRGRDTPSERRATSRCRSRFSPLPSRDCAACHTAGCSSEHPGSRGTRRADLRLDELSIGKTAFVFGEGLQGAAEMTGAVEGPEQGLLLVGPTYRGQCLVL